MHNHDYIIPKGGVLINIHTFLTVRVYNWASEASPTWVIHLGFFIYYYYYYYRTYVGDCMAPFFFFYGVRCAQYKVHAQCSFAALAPHMPCMLLVYTHCINLTTGFMSVYVRRCPPKPPTHAHMLDLWF